MTAMQKHIEQMKIMMEFVNNYNTSDDLKETLIESILGCIENAESFLEEEKEQIKSAFIEGRYELSISAENYYKKL